uniref:Sodium/hydrogen exchanger n=1 Tax=Panagrellus redivivus TaxID=6233 RepID=A0A7E4V7J0_PANRE
MMRLRTLKLAATCTLCVFLLIGLLYGSEVGEDNAAYASNDVHSRKKGGGDVFVVAKGDMAEAAAAADNGISILDPVSLQLHNMSDGFGNNTEKLQLIETANAETGQANSQAEEKKDSLATFFILLVIVLAILLVHLLIITEFHYMPESLAIVLLGAFIGLILSYSKWDWREVESFNPNFFFLVLLPPIIFESGYNLQKGNFFANILPILTFAIIGTTISAFIIGTSMYVLGQADLIYPLTTPESFAFGSMISAVDPVATLAIFQALKVDGQVYMLVFGESMLNDALAIVLTTTCLELNSPSMAEYTSWETFQYGFGRFVAMFFVSAALGGGIGFLSALVFKHIDFRRTPSLELALLFVFAYIPFGLAEALSLSGIMAILFCAITMSQYTHLNISPMAQITMQQTLRTISFVAETCTFAYLGLALFTIKLVFQPVFLIWSIILIFVSRACNIFPLSFMINKCRRTQISMKNQVIMWFSGMRGAVCLALVLYMDLENEQTKQILLTTTLFILLFTIVFLGGSTLPLIKILSVIFPNDRAARQHKKYLRKSRKQRGQKNGQTRVRKSSPVLLSKTHEMAAFDNSEHFTTTEVEDEGARGAGRGRRKNFFTRINESIVRPLFVRKFTQQERLENKQRFRNIASEALKAADLSSAMASRANSSSDEDFFVGAAAGRDSHPLLAR